MRFYNHIRNLACCLSLLAGAEACHAVQLEESLLEQQPSGILKQIYRYLGNEDRRQLMAAGKVIYQPIAHMIKHITLKAPISDTYLLKHLGQFPHLEQVTVKGKNDKVIKEIVSSMLPLLSKVKQVVLPETGADVIDVLVSNILSIERLVFIPRKIEISSKAGKNFLKQITILQPLGFSSPTLTPRDTPRNISTLPNLVGKRLKFDIEPSGNLIIQTIVQNHSKLPQLQKLDLSPYSIDDIGAKSLLDFIPTTKLQEVWITGEFSPNIQERLHNLHPCKVHLVKQNDKA